MYRLVFLVLTAGLCFGLRAIADEAAHAVIEKAIKAAGGEDALKKYPAAHWKGKGKFFGFGEGIEYTGEWHRQFPNQTKTEITAEFGGMKIQNIRIVNGDKGWATNMGAIAELDKDQMMEAMEALHYDRVVSLTPLKGKEYQLAALGDSMVDKTAVTGIKVSLKGRRDVSLYFDKASGLLVKATIKVKDQNTGFQEVEQEMHYSGHQEIQGMKIPRKTTVKREGKTYIEGEITEYKRLEKLDEKVFAKPN